MEILSIEEPGLLNLTWLFPKVPCSVQFRVRAKCQRHYVRGGIFQLSLDRFSLTKEMLSLEVRRSLLLEGSKAWPAAWRLGVTLDDG